jgi:hypothetical protein
MKNDIIKENFSFKIPIEDLFLKFEEHLSIKGNKRILFSGKFGIGKTYFLKEFFKKKQDKYEYFHLFPVNYQISSSEDIIEFIKADILVELLKKNKEIFTENDYNKCLYWFFFLKSYSKEIFKIGIDISDLIDLRLSIFLKLGHSLIEVLDLIKNLKELKKKISKENIIENFLKNVKEKKVTETDYISEIIKEKIKEQSGEKESILVLDDLDRLDPEHIFRILNVFSAHFDLNNEELPNKFGFDKIIIVADYSNLKSIFHHKYGENTDSSGYFNKFFSVEVFQFKNEEIIKKTIEQLILMFQIKDEEIKKNIKQEGFIKIIIEDVLKRALELDGREKINMWQLLKGIKFSLPAFNNRKNYHFTEELIFQNIKISILVLISIFDGIDTDLLSVLEKIKDNLSKTTKNDCENKYNGISYWLLNKLGVIDFKKYNNLQETILLWEEYKIKINFVEHKVMSVEKNPGYSSNQNVSLCTLFYDLLVKYVKQGLHNKPVNFS